MFIKTPRTKKKKNGVIVEGPYLILMRHQDQPAKAGLTAIVWHARLRPFMNDNDLVSVRGNVMIEYHKLMVVGLYGNNGLPVPVVSSLFKMGAPVPEAIYELWRTQNDKLGKGREEVVQWAHALHRLSHKHTPSNTCYRCGEQRDTTPEHYPCTKCAAEIIHISKTINIQPTGIPSREEFGNV